MDRICLYMLCEGSDAIINIIGSSYKPWGTLQVCGALVGMVGYGASSSSKSGYLVIPEHLKGSMKRFLLLWRFIPLDTHPMCVNVALEGQDPV